jgi:hypothetical protein
LDGQDGKPGWLESRKSKTFLYDHAADAFRDRDTTIHNPSAFFQLQSIDGDELRAPEGEKDDLAVAYVLALMGVRVGPRGGVGPVDHKSVQRQGDEKRPFGAAVGAKSPFGFKDTRG